METAPGPPLSKLGRSEVTTGKSVAGEAAQPVKLDLVQSVGQAAV